MWLTFPVNLGSSRSSGTIDTHTLVLNREVVTAAVLGPHEFMFSFRKTPGCSWLGARFAFQVLGHGAALSLCWWRWGPDWRLQRAPRVTLVHEKGTRSHTLHVSSEAPALSLQQMSVGFRRARLALKYSTSGCQKGWSQAALNCRKSVLVLIDGRGNRSENETSEHDPKFHLRMAFCAEEPERGGTQPTLGRARAWGSDLSVPPPHSHCVRCWKVPGFPLSWSAEHRTSVSLCCSRRVTVTLRDILSSDDRFPQPVSCRSEVYEHLLCLPSLTQRRISIALLAFASRSSSISFPGLMLREPLCR